eukprot:CAMPEP_0116940420 /NCGR_PEP_ID=MMETSP0467-20121206/33357_1 /TAXON_ID=283647 /ORGANISM="Mesodinium pulex, Strain SPMC105" /LENGTH=172 /DNA_ID=CAMNT_0004622959 /DNA_START=319 /DNA_END=837 /DNA_ORIENTATION=-
MQLGVEVDVIQPLCVLQKVVQVAPPGFAVFKHFAVLVEVVLDFHLLNSVLHVVVEPLAERVLQDELRRVHTLQTEHHEEVVDDALDPGVALLHQLEVVRDLEHRRDHDPDVRHGADAHGRALVLDAAQFLLEVQDECDELVDARCFVAGLPQPFEHLGRAVQHPDPVHHIPV